ncbi:MAG: hypothetical protein AABW88_00180 [Nanoarchaeota archaeon]
MKSQLVDGIYESLDDKVKDVYFNGPLTDVIGHSMFTIFGIGCSYFMTGLLIDAARKAQDPVYLVASAAGMPLLSLVAGCISAKKLLTKSIPEFRSGYRAWQNYQQHKIIPSNL